MRTPERVPATLGCAWNPDALMLPRCYPPNSCCDHACWSRGPRATVCDGDSVAIKACISASLRSGMAGSPRDDVS
eukprot:4801310-Heterocapsa_arctica.AAC.1